MAITRRRPGHLTTKNDVALARANAELYSRIIDRSAGVVRTVIRWAGTFAVAYEVKGAAETIVNGQIAVDGVLRLVVSGGAERWIMWGVAAICGVFAYRERKLRRKVTMSQGARIRGLEEKVDAGRSSSRLLSDGRPSKEDGDDDA